MNILKLYDMKNVCKKCNLIVKTILLFMMLFVNTLVFADNEWVMVIQNADGESKEIPMSEVGSLVAIDDAYDFSILSTSGNILAEGVFRVSFEQKDPTTIKHIESDNKMMGRVVSDKITLIGVSGEIEVFDAAGIRQIKTMATGGETTINITQLLNGVYVVKAGKQTFKFIKK